MRKTLLLLILAFSAISASSQLENYTFKLSKSTTAYTFWTTTPSQKVFKSTIVPSSLGDKVKVYAAKNEFEPAIVVVNPKSSGSVAVSMGSFGAGITAELFQVKYVNVTQASDNLGTTGYNPDPLWPISSGAQVQLTAGENTAFWINIYVPTTTAAGDYTANFTIAGINIPVTIHVFNFAVPAEVHTQSLMYFSIQNVLTKYGVSGTGTEYWNYVDKIKTFFINHRLTPSSPLWPGGLTGSGGAPFINYDCNGNFSDKDGIWGFENPADKYLKGNGFNNGTGFPSFMAATFRNNSSSADQRPDAFCSVSRTASDWYTGNNPLSAYNAKWFKYISSMQSYLTNKGLINKAYYYFANEPQDQAGYDAIAWYSQQLKKAAPNLKLMVSEEPKAEIYNHPVYKNAKIDIWLPVLHNYNPEISFARETNFGEHTWIYFLKSTRPPYFNPITLDHPGHEYKFTGWFLWKYRLKGIAYYATNDWSQNPWTQPLKDNHNGELFLIYPPSESNTNIAYGSNNHRIVPSIRVELMRDGLEDYEYLYLLNGSAHPKPNVQNTSDIQVNKMISGLTAYTRNDEFMYNLRRLIGMKLGGETTTIADIVPPVAHPRALGQPSNYYINFQDPAGQPTANPLIVNNKTYLKIGWNTYSSSLGYGWFGEMANVKYQYLTSGVTNVLQQSIIYDDWGREKTFEFDLPNGTYNVTVSVGWYNKTYSHQKINIEGVVFVNNEATTPTTPYLVRTKQVTVTDAKLTMLMGIFNEYTMLNYMDIIAVKPTSVDEKSETGPQLKVYPNPFSDGFTIEPQSKEGEVYNVEILNISGKVIRNFPSQTGRILYVARQNLPSGCYFVKINYPKTGKIQIAKVLVE
jgi:hypothetical protein